MLLGAGLGASLVLCLWEDVQGSILTVLSLCLALWSLLIPGVVLQAWPCCSACSLPVSAELHREIPAPNPTEIPTPKPH